MSWAIYFVRRNTCKKRIFLYLCLLTCHKSLKKLLISTNIMRTILLYLLTATCIGLGTACQPKSPNTSNTTPQGQTQTAVGKDENGLPLYEKDYETTSTGKRIRRSAMGVTVRFPDGWKKEDMDFHIGYCQQMMGKVENLDSDKFCRCFLDKAQYYYEPIYVRDAYEHQQHWNKECFEFAHL